MAQISKQNEQIVTLASGIKIAYDTFGDPEAPSLLLVCGLGQQLVSFDEEFCSQLAAKGYWTIRFDNRDIGLSTAFDEARVPRMAFLFPALARANIIRVPYKLRDMASDAVGLLDALEIEAAHVVGFSLGGMIGQMMAIHHPERVATLTSVMSTTGNPSLPGPTKEAAELLRKRAPEDRAAYLDFSIQTWQTLNGPRYPLDEESTRRRAGLAFDRGLNPAGFARQYAAILASSSRKEALISVAVPTLVIHGDADPLVPVEGGIDTADAIPGAKLLIIKGMGHALPPSLWPEIIEAVASHTAAASG